MSFPRYPEYKDSGVEWLGEVPAHWGITQLRYAISSIESGTSVNSTDLPAEDGEVGVLKTSCVYRGYFEPTENKRVVPDEIGRVSCPLKKDSLIVSRMNTPDLIGASGLVQSVADGIYLPDRLWQVSFNERALPSFMHLWASSANYRAQVQVACAGTSSSMQNLSQDGFRGFWLTLPPQNEQAGIAKFLGEELKKVDDLVQEQERLIALLKEKRQAVISHAVTRGLDPSVPMKDSGIEWLGEVPAHWEVGPVKRFFQSLDSRRIPLSSEERGGRSGDFPYYGASGVIDHIDDYIFDEDLVLVSEDGANILARSSPIAFVARGRYWVNNHAHILKPIDAAVVYWSERIEAINVSPFATGSAQPKLTIEALMNLAIAVPPSEIERLNIEKYIVSAAEEIDSLSEEAIKGISLLEERRGALVSAAVTGRIDVRLLTPVEAA